jgi:hypothetical protein
MIWVRLIGWLALTALGLWVRSYYRKKEKEELARSAGTFEAAAAIKNKYRALESCGLVVVLIASAQMAVIIFARD